MVTAPFNPLDTESIAKSICDELLRQPVLRLIDMDEVKGAGIYAIYYVGKFQPYEPISSMNASGRFHQPIYVGKAAPEGSRKGGISKDLVGGKPFSRG